MVIENQESKPPLRYAKIWSSVTSACISLAKGSQIPKTIVKGLGIYCAHKEVIARVWIYIGTNKVHHSVYYSR
jgi:hypothetical protein